MPHRNCHANRRSTEAVGRFLAIPRSHDYDAGYGLTPETIDYISKVKGEQEWIREFRHQRA